MLEDHQSARGQRLPGLPEDQAAHAWIPGRYEMEFLEGSPTLPGSGGAGQDDLRLLVKQQRPGSPKRLVGSLLLCRLLLE